MGGADSIRESTGVGGNRNHLNLSETALLIADFVNARPKTTICDIVEKFAVDRKSASQHLRRLWLGGFVGKRARGLFQPLASSPIPCEDSGDTDDSEHTEDLAEQAVGSDGVEGIERVEDSRDTEGCNSADIAKYDDSEDTVDTEEPEDIDDTELVDRENVSADGFVDIDDTYDRALTDNNDDSDGSKQSADGDDTGDSEDSEDSSASAGLTSGLQALAAATKGNPKACPAGRCPDCGSELGKSTGKCLTCILDRARTRADQSGDSVVRNQTAACW